MLKESFEDLDFALDPSLVLYLPLYKKDGRAFTSEDAHGHLCTVAGAIWTPQGRVFDGDDVIIVPHVPSLAFTTEITVMAWVNASLLGTNIGIAGKWKSDGNYAFNFRKEANNTVRLRVDNTILTSFLVYSTTTVMLNIWYCITASYSASAIRMYVNGILENEGVGGNGITSSTANLIIGAITPLPDQPWRGKIGEFLLFNRELSSSEIANLYLATKWRYQ